MFEIEIEEDIICYARMNGALYAIGHPDIQRMIRYPDETCALRIMLTPENIECLLNCAKEAGLV